MEAPADDKEQVMLKLLRLMERDGLIENSRKAAAEVGVGHDEAVGVINSMVANELALFEHM